MDILIYVLHIMVCVVLVIVVLLQRGKGADMGAMLGGGASNTVFGARGAGNFLTKLTTGCAVLFMITSLSLSYLGNLGAEDALFDETFEELEESAPEAAGAAGEEGASSSALEEIPAPAAQPEAAPSEDERTGGPAPE